MVAPALRIFALLTCVAATSVAQQPPPAPQVLDEVTVSGPRERPRPRDPDISVERPNVATVSLEDSVGIQMRLVGAGRTQVVFRRSSAARQLPGTDSKLSRVNRLLRLKLLPDRIVELHGSWVEAAYLLAANIDEADGVPAHIPFGRGVALLNLDHVSIREGSTRTRIAMTNVMHPQTRRCEPAVSIFDFWPEGTNPYILLGNSLGSCERAVRRRDGDLLFAENVPGDLKRVVQELYGPIASRLANRLGSEPGNMFVAWWPDSPHDGYRLQLSWNRNSLLLFNGFDWQRGIDAAQRESLRLSLMREQIARRIRESDWPGPFTQAAVSYLLLLTRSGEDSTTPQRLSEELPTWIVGCAAGIQGRRATIGSEGNVSSLECGLLLQFVYDAVARYESAGAENIYSIWRKLLDESSRQGKSGASQADFLDSSAEARRIALGLMDGTMDWSKFSTALDGVGVRMNALAGGTSPVLDIRSLEHFQD